MDQESTECEDSNQSETLDSNWIFGFVFAKEFDGLGYCGGYLILNGFGHPCEFHCSLPLKPTRTQEILYGDRLREFLIGHSIVPQLLGKAKLAPSIVLANDASAVSAEISQKYPIALVKSLDHPTGDEGRSIEDPLLSEPACSETGTCGNDTNRETSFRLPRHLNGWNYHVLNDRQRVVGPHDLPTRKLKIFTAQFCLIEPFNRIVDALTEAQSVAAA